MSRTLMGAGRTQSAITVIDPFTASAADARLLSERRKATSAGSSTPRWRSASISSSSAGISAGGVLGVLVVDGNPFELWASSAPSELHQPVMGIRSDRDLLSGCAVLSEDRKVQGHRRSPTEPRTAMSYGLAPRTCGPLNGRSCCSEGRALRASATLARSISAVMKPGSEPPASASTSPQGPITTEWP